MHYDGSAGGGRACRNGIREEPIASTLRRDLDRLEADFLRSIFVDPSKVAALQAIEWRDTGTQVYLPKWRESIAANSEVLRGVRMRQLPSIASSLPFFSKQLQLQDVGLDKRSDAAKAIVGCALAVRLSDDGWVCDAEPGRPVTMTKEGRTIAPFTIITRLGSGELREEEWSSECAISGITEQTLA
ncbi:MAG TPA: hypothetical protein VF713_09065 [Thermoanaerobaculia bacterium]